MPERTGIGPFRNQIRAFHRHRVFGLSERASERASGGQSVRSTNSAIAPSCRFFCLQGDRCTDRPTPLGSPSSAALGAITQNGGPRTVDVL
ncbi:hypothetical protein OPV22_034466 [Ensete ventricosum]|uniref:Uncharacterized protein n=1 Tax=Ensete ventricosum TaxID=4639 RepID=A0AAV8PUN2_ENSVE|nr:hypothetical protein OPV22_034466 [Ensete ventricosum]